MLSSVTSATEVSVTLGSSPLCHQRAEITYFDIIQNLSVQLEKSRQQLRDIKANFCVTRATLYVLANQLRTCSKFSRVAATTTVKEHSSPER